MIYRCPPLPVDQLEALQGGAQPHYQPQLRLGHGGLAVDACEGEGAARVSRVPRVAATCVAGEARAGGGLQLGEGQGQTVAAAEAGEVRQPPQQRGVAGDIVAILATGDKRIVIVT